MRAMRLCRCPAPLRSTATLDRLRCLRCGDWTGHGRLLAVDRTTAHTAEVASLATKIADDWAWVYDLAHDPTRHGHGQSRSTDVADPTLAAVLAGEHRIRTAHDPGNEIRPRIAAYAAITSRLLERSLAALRNADQACGEALLAGEPPGPADHVQAPFHDPASLYPGRPDLAAAHAAQDRRRGRGEL